MNVKVSVQLAPAASVCPLLQEPPVFVKPAGALGGKVTAAEAVPPVFVTVTVCAAEALPTSMLPKAREEFEAETFAGVTVGQP